MRLRWIVAGTLALGLATVGPGHTFRLALLAATLVVPVAGIHAAITSGPRVPNYQERYLLQMQGIDPDQLPKNWRELAFNQWQELQTTFERAAALAFPGQQGRQARFVCSCWMRWELRQLDIDRAKAAENSIRQLEIR